MYCIFEASLASKQIGPALFGGLKICCNQCGPDQTGEQFDLGACCLLKLVPEKVFTCSSRLQQMTFEPRHVNSNNVAL